ncbi:unnamed protein product [Schistosoma margrebowiei]|uniref:Uncharacterized protein n=1 Tax=Schistosoma margrebowiei TaxID=48269 RepID=A0A183MTN6_9TREM|nr:unnamed protein product [Schistosoma margrebowiei]
MVVGGSRQETFGPGFGAIRHSSARCIQLKDPKENEIRVLDFIARYNPSILYKLKDILLVEFMSQSKLDHYGVQLDVL